MAISPVLLLNRLAARMPLLVAIALLVCHLSAAVEVVDLKCDRLTDPIGVDRTPLMLSWKLECVGWIVTHLEPGANSASGGS